MKVLLKKLLVLFSVMTLSSCSLFSKTVIPYSVDGEMTVEESSDYKTGGLNLSFFNKSEKQVSKFVVVFFLFDEDGNSPLIGRNNIVLSVTASVEAEQLFQYCFSLDQYLCEIPDEPYQVDYLYVSEITYEDGTTWKDPFGVYAF